MKLMKQIVLNALIFLGGITLFLAIIAEIGVLTR